MEDEYGSFDEGDVEVAPRLQQRTLFGGIATVQLSQGAATYTARRRNREEAATHHVLDTEAIKTWVFPTNYAQRDYQYNMILKALYTNLLVALPTGLGKTFIAAVVMYNWYRWAPRSKIIFLAPAKPLVTQQIEACYHVCGIPARDTAELTGGVPKGKRLAAYTERRVFFLTPQTFQNDLRNGLIKAKDISCLVVDEAHHATGNYAYVDVVRQLRAESDSFRVLALTATPGKSVEAVQEVIDGLQISQIEIRSESSIDIRQYIHTKEVETVLLDLTDDILSVQAKFASLLKPMIQKLLSMGVGMTPDPTKVSAFAIQQAILKLRLERRPNANAAYAVGGILSSLAYNMELLNTHGVRPFYDAMLELKNGVKASENKKRVVNDPKFHSMMQEMRTLIEDENYTGHPKLDHLSNVILDHFARAQEEGNTQTRAMVFANLRVSASAIVTTLKRHDPLIKATPFYGQSAGKDHTTGMSQREQAEIISKFKAGIFNVIVATSVGEEGLDIGEIDLIICYDAQSSPARMLQRMGRTGRKRDGHVYVLCVRGKEELNFAKAKDAHRVMQKKIEKGIDINLVESPRIIPWNVEPRCEKRLLEVPEGDNKADRELKSTLKRKRESKKYNTGFVKAGTLVQEPEFHGIFEGLNDADIRELTTRYAIDETDEQGHHNTRREEGVLMNIEEIKHVVSVKVGHSDTTKRLLTLTRATLQPRNLMDLEDRWRALSRSIELPPPKRTRNVISRTPSPDFGEELDGEIVLADSTNRIRLSQLARSSDEEELPDLPSSTIKRRRIRIEEED